MEGTETQRSPKHPSSPSGQVLVRLQSRDGQERVQVDRTATVEGLRQAISEQLQIPLEEIQLSENGALLLPEKYSEELLLKPDVEISSLDAINSGQILYLKYDIFRCVQSFSKRPKLNMQPYGACFTVDDVAAKYSNTPSLPGADMDSWNVLDRNERLQILIELYEKLVRSAKKRRSLRTGNAAAKPARTVIPGIGEEWDHIIRPEMVLGMAELMINSCINHQSSVSEDITHREPFGGCFVNPSGAGKTVGMRWSPFDALDLMEKSPQLFPGFASDIQQLLQITRRTVHLRLSYIFNFNASGNEPGLYMDSLTPRSLVAWSLLFSMLRGSELPERPNCLQKMLTSVPRVVRGKRLDVDEFKRQLYIGDVMSLLRRVHGIDETEKIGVFIAWDETILLSEKLLQGLSQSLLSYALGPNGKYTWVLLTIASTISRSTQPDNAGIIPNSGSTIRRYQLIPMHPMLMPQMLTLVVSAWKLAKPGRNNYKLHESIQYWVALVEGNPRLLECLLAAASGSPEWNCINTDGLDRFLSRGVVTEAEAKRILDSLLTFTDKLQMLGHNAITADDDSKWLLSLLGRCLLGTVVRSYDSIDDSGKLTYVRGQGKGLLTLKVESSNSELQDPAHVQGTVHMPAIVVYSIYRSAIKSGLFKHHQPLLSQWEGLLPRHLINSKVKESVDPAAVALKLEFLRVVDGRSTVTLGELLPMKDATDKLYGDIAVEIPEDLDQVALGQKDIKSEALVPAGRSLLIGEGTATDGDSHIRLRLANGTADYFLVFQSKYHDNYGVGVEANLAKEYRKAKLDDIPDDRQLFVLCTDAAEANVEGLPDNVVVIDAGHHPAFYNRTGVGFRKLVSVVLHYTHRKRVDDLAYHAVKSGATDKDVEQYKKELETMLKEHLIDYARDKGLTLPDEQIKTLTKRTIADLLFDHLKAEQGGGQ
eukprot:GHUV01003582.1.p1 GENE.GHUV01003582.1~~GHUV01003582.1.p1  ORF type:complete len:933 (+),score=222.33 GHUV01003582.1:384-3182(+)